MRFAARKILPPFFAALLVACATFRTNEPFVPSPLAPVASELRPSVTLAIRGERSADGQEVGLGGVIDRWQHEAIAVFEQSGFFRSVALGLAPADLRAWITLRANEESSDALATFSLATGLLFPYPMTTELTVDLRVEDSDADVLASATRSERIRTWVHLLLLPLAPFFRAEDVHAQAVRDLVQAALAEVASQGAFSLRASVEPPAPLD